MSKYTHFDIETTIWTWTADERWKILCRRPFVVGIDNKASLSLVEEEFSECYENQLPIHSIVVVAWPKSI